MKNSRANSLLQLQEQQYISRRPSHRLEKLQNLQKSLRNSEVDIDIDTEAVPLTITEDD